MQKDQVPSPLLEPERYKGRPLLLILDNYILDCIGELPPDKQKGVGSLVQQVWGGDADWKKTVRAILNLTKAMDENVRELWKTNQQIAKENNATLHPVQFAKMLVDENFLHLIEQLEQS
jgi:hypothetical protein